MSVQDIAKLGKLLAQFLAGFACCFARPAGRALLQIYVKGLLSDVQRKNAEAIGCIDETGTAKSGRETAGVKRQYNGNRGKIENCINNVALAYSVPGFDCLLAAEASSRCLRTLAGGRLLPGNKRRTWSGSLRMPRLALHPSTSFRDNSESAVLCPRSPATHAQRRCSQR